MYLFLVIFLLLFQFIYNYFNNLLIYSIISVKTHVKKIIAPPTSDTSLLYKPIIHHRPNCNNRRILQITLYFSLSSVLSQYYQLLEP